jgi:hypothetical protein
MPEHFGIQFETFFVILAFWKAGYEGKSQSDGSAGFRFYDIMPATGAGSSS